MSKKHTYVLGINLSHDGSACLLKDGVIVFAIEKERLTRIKHDGGNDKLTVEYCLQAEGINIDDVDLVVQNANFEKDSLQIDRYSGQRAFPANYNVPVITISHHLAHAYSAIGTSPFDACNIMVIDGCGSPYSQCDDLEKALIPDVEEIKTTSQNFWCEKLSLYNYTNQKITPIYKDFSPFRHTQPAKPLQMPTITHSIGGVYQTASEYCFGSTDDTGKLMGLSPYGEKGVYKQAIFELKDGRVFNTFDWMNGLTCPSHSYQNFKTNFQYYANIARWVQDETERALLYLFNHHQKQYPQDNWCYAGGVALNAVANQRIWAETDIQNLYIQPAAADNGIAIGCAYYGWLEVLKRERVKHNGNSNFGKHYPQSNIESTNETIIVNEGNNTTEATATLLASGKVIGWFTSGSEFGPRALGFRSILAHPAKEGLRDYINKEIKNREDFRPFAPAVLREDVTLYFKYDWDSPYMILVNPVKKEWEQKLQNVVHLNGTARVQTVTAQNNPALYNLLMEFKKITGLSLLLNTSFNNRGMPIVETPQQAFNFFVNSPLDALIIDNKIYSKQTHGEKISI